MGEAASKLTDGFHLLRLEQRLLGTLEFHLCLAALSQIASDLCEANDLPAFFNRVNDHTGPEAGTILSDAPALRNEPPLLSRRFEGPLRHSSL